MKHIKLFEEFISKSENDKSVNESFLVTAAAAAAGVAGLMVLVKTAPFFRRVAGEASQMLGSAVLRKLEKDRLDKYTAIIDGIVTKFEGDEVLKTMYTELPAYSDLARDNASNVARTKQLKVIGEYIKTKLSEDELKYFVDISKSLRGLAEISESKSLRESTNSGVTVDGKPVKFSSIELGNVHKWDRPDFADEYASYAEFEDGKKLTDAQLDKLTDDHADVINDIANNQ
jgi:hypothetical protein